MLEWGLVADVDEVLVTLEEVGPCHILSIPGLVWQGPRLTFFAGSLACAGVF